MGRIVTSSDRTPKGNTGMTALTAGTGNDDRSYVFPDIGFDFYYNGTNVRASIYSSGNSWVGFGSATEHLDINRRDAKSLHVYYINEVENGKTVFRIRWEGSAVYNSGLLDLAWELIFYDDNTLVLVIDLVPSNTGTNSFVNPSGTNLTFSYTTGKSYVFLPTGTTSGTLYTLTEGYYVQTTVRYLVDDGTSGIKHWDNTNSTWTKVGDEPVTEDMFLTYGDTVFNISRTGLTLTNPTLLCFVQDLNEGDHSIKETLTPPYRPIIQNFDYSIPTGIKSVVLTSTVSGNSKILCAASIDSGTTWQVFNGTIWSTIDISSLSTFETNGITPTALNAITQAQWATLVGSAEVIRFAYYFKQTVSTETCLIDEMRVNYV
jgi:hypothetical protein